MKLGAIIFNIVGILTLFMGAFLIFNTFRTLVVERRRDIGMLRAVGATRGTITRLILVESALQGVIGTAIGLVLGYLLGVGMATALDGMLDRFVRIRLGAPVVPPEAVILAVVLGVGMTVLAGLLPALSAGRMPVLVALRGEQMEAVRKRATIGSIIGAGIVVIGAVLLVVGNAGMATFGGVLILTGLVMLGALLLHPIARGLDPVIRWLFAREGVLAEGNLERNPGRSSITMSALMIALALIVALWAVFSSIQDSYTRNLQKTLSADILLLPPSLGVWTGVVGVTDEFVQQLAQVPGVGDITGVSYAPVLVDGTSVQMMGIDPVTYPKVSSVLFTDGDDGTYAKLADGRTAILSGILASSLGAKVGDTVSVQTPQGTQPYHVVGIGADFTSMKIAAMYISKQNMAGDFANPDDIMLMANLAAEADGAAVRANIETLLKDYPQLTLYWGADFRAQTAQELEQLFSAFYFILLALAIPSVLGLINTLAINVLERTREIGVLRAIGATRGQIRRLVVAESLLLAMVGTALGLLAGVALGYALVSYIGASVYATNYYFPFVGILLTIALGFVLALLASVLPARQAARVKIVQALQYGLHDADVGEVAVKLLVIQAVTDDEAVGDVEADVGEADVEEANTGAVEEGADAQGGGLAAADHLHQICERKAGVYYVLYYEDVPAGDRFIEVFDHAHAAVAACIGAVGGDGEEIDAGREVKRDSAHEVGHERDHALENAHEMEGAVRGDAKLPVIVCYLVGQLSDSCLYLLFGDEGLNTCGEARRRSFGGGLGRGV
jgi:putative ABC transport system permease protein